MSARPCCLAPVLAGLLLNAVQPEARADENTVFHQGFEASAAATCVEKSIRLVNGNRLGFAFPTVNGVAPGSQVDSACIRLTGVGDSLSFTANAGALVSRNQGPFQAPPIALNEGDELRLRLSAPDGADQERTSYIQIGGAFLADFSVRSANRSRAAQTFEVGPNKPYRELSEIAGLLVAGDTVLLDRNARYAPVEFRRAGLADAPITVRAADGAGARPIIEGGSTTLSLRGAHHYRLQSLEITGGSQVCVRHEANDVWLSDVHVHGCARHGILGADLYSGSLRISASEVNDVGGQPSGENLKHPIYVATDRDRYPGAVLRVERSYIHDYGGNGIKSRSERAEIYQNWIDASSRSFYTIELNGYEEYLPEPGLSADVFGNVLVHRDVYGMRMGGDGTGALRGRVRIAHNTFLVGQGFTQYIPVLRFFGELESVSVRNNVFARLTDAGGALPIRLTRDDATWISGTRQLDGQRNWAPSGSDAIAAGYLPEEWQNTTLGTQPGFNALNPAALNLALQPTAAIGLVPLAADATDEPFRVSNPLRVSGYRTPLVVPPTGDSMANAWTTAPVQAPSTIGAF